MYAVIITFIIYGLWKAIPQILFTTTTCKECGREVSKRQGRVHYDKDYIHWSCFLKMQDGEGYGK